MLFAPDFIFPGLKWRGVHLTIQPPQMLRIRMRGAITLFRPYILPWLAQKISAHSEDNRKQILDMAV
jgi:hypothetical protein